jgi:chromosome segregation ATPase
MEVAQEPSVDSLASLEERITRAVQVITELRAQNAQMTQRVSGLEADLNHSRAAMQESELNAGELLKERNELDQKAKRLSQEVEEMRSERKQVRSRIEKLLSQLDLLSAS